MSESIVQVSPGSRSGTDWRQFGLLVLINCFVGGMVGLERTILPIIAVEQFGIASKAAATAFIASFGICKALLNLAAGNLSDRWGRRRVLVAGWIIGLPVPLLLIWAPSWSWVLVANVLLGANQALTWSMTVNMKIDLVGPGRRGLAVGFNESAGYCSLAAVAFFSGTIASSYGLRPAPMYLGVIIAVLGTLLSLITRETHSPQIGPASRKTKPLLEIFRDTTRGNRLLAAACLGGLLMNLQDGMLWGLLPLFLRAQGLQLSEIALVVGIYPAVWGIAQIAFGILSDRTGRILPGATGLVLQAVGTVGFIAFHSLDGYIVASVITGLGTAMSYPALLALVSDIVPLEWRASALGVYRFWRDLGYAFGALGVGFLADLLGIQFSYGIVALLLVYASLRLVLNANLVRHVRYELPAK
jgi:MFS family permease